MCFGLFFSCNGNETLESNMKTYGMFSDLGNTMVDCIVNKAKRDNLTWKQVYGMLCELADLSYDRFGEATDTVVREAVYSAVFEMETV
jgi:hypothetical protein